MTIHGPAASRDNSWLSYLPVAWLIFVMAWSAHGLSQSVPFLGSYDLLPAGVSLVVYGGMALSGITMLWGLFMLGLVFNGSARFARQFIAWQAITIAWSVASQAIVLLTPGFDFSLRSLAITAGEIVMGLLCIYVVKRKPGALAGSDTVGAAQAAQPIARGKVSVLVLLAVGVLGLIVGGAVGTGLGVGGGILYVESVDSSCFEGSCGYLALFTGFAGLVIGAIVGAILAVWLVLRRNKRRGATE